MAGRVSAQVAGGAEALTKAEKLITTLFTLATDVGVDETTLNVGGRKQWLHVARAATLAAYHLHKGCGRATVDDLGVLPGYPIRVVHDGLSVYQSPDYRTACHSLCGAHLPRQPTAVAAECHGAIWLGQARRALADSANVRAAHDQGSGRIALTATQSLMYRDAVLAGLTEYRRAAGRDQSKARNPLKRPRKDGKMILRFPAAVVVPLTIKGSKRDFGPVKTQIRFCGCHGAATGVQAWLRIPPIRRNRP